MNFNFSDSNSFTKKLNDQINFLKKLASKSAVSHKHAACLINGNGKIITFGLNKYINSKINSKPIRICIHAEQDCLANCHFKFCKGMDLLVIRIGPTGGLLNSRPCNLCVTKLQEKQIRKVYYSDSNGDIVCETVDNMKKIHTCSGIKFRELSQ